MSPIIHSLHEDLHLLISTWSGTVTDAEMIEGYRKAYADRRWVPGFNEVTDLRRADLRAVTADGLRGVRLLVSESVAGFTGTFRTAVLAPTDLGFGLSRMYELMSDESTESVRVCRDAQDAAAWVGIPVSVLSL
jgi:hypothetical protein